MLPLQLDQNCGVLRLSKCKKTLTANDICDLLKETLAQTLSWCCIIRLVSQTVGLLVKQIIAGHFCVAICAIFFTLDFISRLNLDFVALCGV